jgi:hypothetical protein
MSIRTKIITSMADVQPGDVVTFLHESGTNPRSGVACKTDTERFLFDVKGYGFPHDYNTFVVAVRAYEAVELPTRPGIYLITYITPDGEEYTTRFIAHKAYGYSDLNFHIISPAGALSSTESCLSKDEIITVTPVLLF